MPRQIPLCRLFAVIAVGVGLLLPSGCATVVVRRGVERRVERRLHEVLGPAELYRVRIRDTRDPELVQGRARRVEVVGRNIQAKSQFLLEALTLTLQDLRYVGGEPYFVSVARSDLHIEFTDAALNSYLRRRKARYEPVVTFLPGEVQVRATYLFLGKPTPMSASGTFQIRDGTRLVFTATSANVPFLPADQPDFSARFVEERLNPLLDLGKLEFPARLVNVELLAGRVKAHGSAALPREGGD
jgi:hypothetical protein